MSEPAALAPAEAAEGRRVVGRIGWLHFANDFTLDFLSPLLPSGVPIAWLGAMEGAANCVGQALKLVTGRASDRSGRRVPWIRAGYGLNAVARPLAAVGIAAAWPVWIVACRIGDRVGKGLRGSAVDALIADWTDPGDDRVRAFYRVRTLDHLGATLGALVAAGAIWAWPRREAALVATLVVPAAAMWWWCRGLADRARPAHAASPAATLWPRDPGLRVPLALLGFGALGARVAPLLVLARVAGWTGDQAPWPLWATCLAWAAFGAVQAGAASLGGVLGPRLGARGFLLAAWAAGGVGLAGIAFLHGPVLAVAGLGYGAVLGAGEGAEKSWLAAVAPPHERATAFGALALVIAGAELVGNGLLGLLLARHGAPAFAVPAAVLGTASLLMALDLRRR